MVTEPVVLTNGQVTATLYCGDCLDILAVLPDESVQCCVTSPPYWGLRDYGVDGQMGLESTPKEYVSKMVAVFREVRRVLRDDGTLWLNLGDSYAGSGRGPTGANGIQQAEKRQGFVGGADPHGKSANKTDAPAGFKAKDLIGIPWRVAFALQADGWYLRSDVIWAKANPMPESVTDRPTKAHEYLFLLAKSARYHYDAEAVMELAAGPAKKCGTNSRANIDRVPRKTLKQDAIGKGTYTGFNARYDFSNPSEKRNLRSVWTIPTQPFPEAHFAVMPEALVKPCILAGCPPGCLVLDPFSGAGTVATVAAQEHCNSLSIELNPAYIDMAVKRIKAAIQQPNLFGGQNGEQSEGPCNVGRHP